MKKPTYRKEFCYRLTRLRMNKDVSARDISLSLGLSESYINKIENMSESFPFEMAATIEGMKHMTQEQLARMTAFMKDINHRK